MIRYLLLSLLLLVSPAYAWTPYNVHGMSYFYGMAVADFDKDGNVDVAYSDSLSNSRRIRPANAIIYLNNMNQGLRKIYTEDFSWHPNNPAPNPHHLIERLVAIDLNGDTWLDIAAVANSHDAVIGYINPGAGGGAWTRQVLTTQTAGAVNLAVGDPDGDGDLDLFVTMRSQITSWPARKSGLGWLRNDGGGVFTYADIDVRSTTAPDEPRTLLAFDVWANGKDCATVGNFVGGQVTTHCLWPGGVWSKNVATGVTMTGHYSAALDLNGDGLKELVYAAADGIYSAQTNWSVTHPIVTKLIHLAPSTEVTEIIATNVDGGGFTDLAFSVRNGPLYWARRVSGAWSAFALESTPFNYYAVAVMDWNGDGKMDILGGVEYPENMLRVFIQP